MDGAVEVAAVNPSIGAANLPAAKADCGDRKISLAEGAVFHATSPHLYCAAIAGAGAKRRSMLRRAPTASVSGISASAQRTISPEAMSRFSVTLCARPIGSAPSARLRTAGTSLPQTVYPPRSEERRVG